jgi:hypothetical protein
MYNQTMRWALAWSVFISVWAWADTTTLVEQAYSVCPDAYQKLIKHSMPDTIGYAVVEKKFFGKTRVLWIDNESAIKATDADFEPSQGAQRLRFGGQSAFSGRLNFVVDTNHQLILGSAVYGPHPTLIGGYDPKVLGAGEAFFEQGLLVEVRYRNTGHFQTGKETKPEVEQAFDQSIPKEAISKRFRGFLDKHYEN